MTNKIAEIEVRQYVVPLVVPFSVAYGTSVDAELTIVVARDDQGREGIGEAAPPSYLSPAEKRKATELIANVCDELVGLEVQEALATLDTMRATLFVRQPIAYVAVELALLSLIAEQSGAPVHAAIQDTKKASCPTDITVPLMEPARVEPFWRLYESYGFSTVKVKVKGDLDHDLACLRELERILPKATKIFLDGNQGFDVDRAVRIWEECAKAKIRTPLFFEQPLPKDDWQGLTELTRRGVMTVCLDETIATAQDVERALREKAGTMINLKLMKSGVRETLAIIELCQRHRVPMMIGGMVESEITMGASLQLYLHCSAITHADLDTPFFMREFLTEQSPWHAKRAELGPAKGAPRLRADVRPVSVTKSTR